MANIAFGSKYFIFSKFSSIPKTSKIEQDRSNLSKEFNDFNEFRDSKELSDFIELGKYLDSSQHKDLLAKNKKVKSAEEDRVKSYETQKKSKKFRDYFKFKESQKLKDYQSFDQSTELSNYLELENRVNSNEFANRKKEAGNKKNTEQKKADEFAALKKSKQIKSWFKFRDSSKLKEFNTISESSELDKYNDLKEVVSSKEFAKKKSDADPKEFKISAEGKKLQEFDALKKSRNIKFYLKFKDSAKYKAFLAFENSSELKKYHELEEYTNSADHKENLSAATKELSDLEGKTKEYQQKKKSKPIKDYYRFKDSQKFKDFTTFENSKELSDYFKLEKYLASDEHKDLVKSLAEQETEENKKIKEHADFRNSKKYKWYLELKDTNKFDELKKWEVVFEDDFSNDKLDTGKWMTRYYWGDKLMDDAYALEHDKAFPTNGDNVETGNTLKITTKRENIEGKVWKMPFGFVPQEFEFTTGLVSTAKSYRLKYGKIEAKIKVNYAKPVNYNFWMASENNLPHVDILKLHKKKSKVDLGNVFGDISDKKGPEKRTAEFSGLDVTQDFFIYSLVWTKDKLTWKINDVVVNEQSQGIPREEMYMVFSSSMTGKADGSGLPASMEVDWVHCYQEK